MTIQVLIVGAGIGGLTAAVALRRLGLAVDVVEQAPRLSAVGAGITIQANATAIFNALGVELPERDIGPIGYFEMISESGKRLMSGDPADAVVQFPSVNIHRADLQSAMLEAFASLGGEVGLGRKVASLEPRSKGERIGVRFADDTTAHCDLLIGADGLHSAVRASLLGPESMQLRYAGQTCWRFVLQAPELVPDITVERWSVRRRIGIVPLSRGRVYVYMVQSEAEGTPSACSSDAATVRDKFAGVDERLDPLLDRLVELDRQGEPVGIHHGDLFEQPRISFGEGRVVLLGDAAHAMTPNMGQGAGTAIEDAAALAVLLDTAALESTASALDDRRHKRVAGVQKMSWRIGAMAHMTSPVLSWFRDQSLALMPASMSRRQMQSLWQPGLELAEQVRQRLGTQAVPE